MSITSPRISTSTKPGGSETQQLLPPTFVNLKDELVQLVQHGTCYADGPALIVDIVRQNIPTNKKAILKSATISKITELKFLTKYVTVDNKAKLEYTVQAPLNNINTVINQEPDIQIFFIINEGETPYHWEKNDVYRITLQWQIQNTDIVNTDTRHPQNMAHLLSKNMLTMPVKPTAALNQKKSKNPVTMALSKKINMVEQAEEETIQIADTHTFDIIIG